MPDTTKPDLTQLPLEETPTVACEHAGYGYFTKPAAADAAPASTPASDTSDTSDTPDATEAE